VNLLQKKVTCLDLQSISDKKIKRSIRMIMTIIYGIYNKGEVAMIFLKKVKI
jgi:hypothetical protein